MANDDIKGRITLGGSLAEQAQEQPQPKPSGLREEFDAIDAAAAEDKLNTETVAQIRRTLRDYGPEKGQAWIAACRKRGMFQGMPASAMPSDVEGWEKEALATVLEGTGASGSKGIGEPGSAPQGGGAGTIAVTNQDGVRSVVPLPKRR